MPFDFFFLTKQTCSNLIKDGAAANIVIWDNQETAQVYAEMKGKSETFISFRLSGSLLPGSALKKKSFLALRNRI